MNKIFMNNKYPLIILILSLSLGMTLLIDRAGLLNYFQLKVYDAWFRIKFNLHSDIHCPTSPVVLIEIDDATLSDGEFQTTPLFYQQKYQTVVKGLIDGDVKVIGLGNPLPDALHKDQSDVDDWDWRRTIQYAGEKGVTIVAAMERDGGRLIKPARQFMDLIGSANIGLWDCRPDPDGVVRRRQLSYKLPGSGNDPVFDYAYLLVRAYHTGPDLPDGTIFIDYVPQYPPFARFSFKRVHQKALAGDTAYLARHFHGKIALIGRTDAWSRKFLTPLPFSGNDFLQWTPGVEIAAHTVDTILGKRFLKEASWLVRLAAYTILILIVVFCAAYHSVRQTFFTGALTLTAWLAGSYLIFTRGLLLPIPEGVAALTIALACYGALSRFILFSKTKIKASSDDINLMLGLNFQVQGMLDMAFEKFRMVPMNDVMPDVLYNLGLEYEQKRMLNKAMSVYEYIRRYDPGYHDLENRILELNRISESITTGIVLGARSEEWEQDELPKPNIGRYEIIRELARGRGSVVYLGEDHKIGRILAIKTIRHDRDGLEEDEKNLSRQKEDLCREGTILKGLSHPNVVTLYDFGKDNNTAYLVLEYCEGRSLGALTADGDRPDVRQAMEMAVQTAEALIYVHERGVIHLNINPQTIIWTRQKNIKLIGFGQARMLVGNGNTITDRKPKPAYMSPERIKGQRLDERSDIFSLGVVLYELLGGARPFRADNPVTCIYKILEETPPPLTHLNPDITPALSKVVEKMVAKNPEDRYRKADTLTGELRRLRL